MAQKKLNITSRGPVQGVASIGGHLTLGDFQTVIDPLAAGNVGINKPASSIPSMFARIQDSLSKRIRYSDCNKYCLCEICFRQLRFVRRSF